MTIGYILACGVHTPIGPDCLSTAMCLRASKFDPRSSSFLDQDGRAVGVCRSSQLPDDLVGLARLVALAQPALSDALAHVSGALGATGDLDRSVPMILAAPEAARPDFSDRDARDIVDTLGARASARLDLAHSRVIRGGSAAFAAAIEAAVPLLESSPAVLVGGVDSYHHPDAIAWLDGERRVHSIGRDGGVVPAEGAGFVLLARRANGVRASRLLSVATGREGAASVGAAAPGDELASAATAVLRNALDDAQRSVHWIVSDENGERWRQRAWHRLDARVASERKSPEANGVRARRDRPVLDLGELGAATGAVLLGVVDAWWRAGCAVDEHALFGLLSDDGERGAFVAAAPAVESRKGANGRQAPEEVFLASLLEPRARTIRSNSRERRAAPSRQTQKLVRDCLEDIAALSCHLQYEPSELWAATHGFEQRILDNTDAFFALERTCDVADLARAYTMDAPFADRGRGFARALLAGSVDDPDRLEVALIDIDFERPAVLRGLEDGLCRAPGGAIAEVMARVLRRASAGRGAGVAALALDVLAFRRDADVAAVAPFLDHPDGRVACAAARALGHTSAAASVAPLLDSILQETEDADLALEAARSLVRLGRRAGLEGSRHWLHRALKSRLVEPDSLVAWASLLAVAGEPSDVDDLAATLALCPEAAPALGFHGDPALVPILIDALDDARAAADTRPGGAGATDLLDALAGALDRITGAPVRDWLTPGGHTERPEGAMAASRRPSRRADDWRAWWSEEGARFSPGRKFRRGKLHDARASLAELADPYAIQWARDLCSLEIAAVAPALRLADIRDWRGRQVRAIEAARAALATPPPGTWTSARLTS